jgi:hypothetical protein
MKIKEAYDKILPYLKTGEVVLNKSTTQNKGANGVHLEKILGLSQNSNRLDFEDGELKTFTLTNTGAVKEDFRICSVWDKDEIRKKLDNVLIVGRDLEGQIIYCKIHRILEENLIFSKYFDIEVDYILENGPHNTSQSETEIWIAKTQSQGGNAKKRRSLYISRPAAHYLFFGEYPKLARKAKKILVG